MNKDSNQIKQDELKRLGQNIKRLRKSKGMNQTLLANQAKTRPTTISSIEKGSNHNPGWDLINRIANVLDSSIHDLTQPGSDLALERRGLPKGLADLMLRQDDLLALGESRIGLQEVEWLSTMPLENKENMDAKAYLLILRHYRLITHGHS